MKEIDSVYNCHQGEHMTMYIRHDDGKTKGYTVDMSTEARRTLADLLIRFLHKETVLGRGFFSCTTFGWHWLRYSEAI